MRDPAALAGRIVAGHPRLGEVRLVTVDGPSGSGKSTLAAGLHAALTGRKHATVLVRTDSFATWVDPFDWWERLEAGVLTPLSTGRPGSYLANDWSTGDPRPGLQVAVPVPEILIVEGVSAGRRAVADLVTTALWVEHPDRSQRLERAVQRDGEQIRRHLVDWQRAEDAWFAADGTRGRADLLLLAN